MSNQLCQPGSVGIEPVLQREIFIRCTFN